MCFICFVANRTIETDFIRYQIDDEHSAGEKSHDFSKPPRPTRISGPYYYLSRLILFEYCLRARPHIKLRILFRERDDVSGGGGGGPGPDNRIIIREVSDKILQ